MASTWRSLNNVAIPRFAAEWFHMIQEDPDIDPAVKRGQRALHVAHTEYRSGSSIRPSEFLHLRAIWPRHVPGVDTFDHYMRDRIIENSVYRGYVSEENDRLAAHICNNPSPQWKTYKEQIGKGRNGFASDPKAGVWAIVRFWQAMVTAHTKKIPAKDCDDSDDDSGDSDEEMDDNITRIVKDGYIWGPLRTIKVTEQLGNMTLGTPDRRLRPSTSQYHTPRAVNLDSGLPAGNPDSVDEMYSNVALLLFLQAATMEAITYLGAVNWLPTRLALKLMAAESADSESSKQVHLMNALVDGYLCRRTSEDDFSKAPLAICEAKPFVRSKNRAKTLRQETAEMASWIAQHGEGGEGLLQSSTSGRKRRLLLSQDRHEVYIIIGEYGGAYEEYITGQTELPATTSVPSDPDTFDIEQNERDAAGSRAYDRLSRWARDHYITAAPASGPGTGSGMQSTTSSFGSQSATGGAGRITRSRSRMAQMPSAPAEVLPPAE
ncbi:hypothetical protein MY3296_003549 [Beauveria thailandica]